MNELQAIAGALSSLKAAGDLAKAFVDVKGAVEVQGKVFELQRVILAAQQDTFSAQQTQTALLQRVGELEERIRDLEAWNREKERYQLEDVGNGCMAFTLKPEAAGTDPPHALCCQCYHQGRPSVLVPFQIREGRAEALQCHACGSEMIVSGVDGRASARSSARGPAPRGR